MYSYLCKMKTRHAQLGLSRTHTDDELSVQPFLIFFCLGLCILCRLLDSSPFSVCRHDEDVVVDEDSDDQDDKTNRRHKDKVVALFAEEGAGQGKKQEDNVDEDHPDLVKYSTSGGCQLLHHRNSCIVEDCNGAHVSKGPANRPTSIVPSKDLVKSVQHIFDTFMWTNAKVWDVLDEVSWPEENAQGESSVDSLKADNF